MMRQQGGAMRGSQVLSVLLVVLTTLGLVVLLAVTLTGCARREALRDRSHEVLNRVTDYADPAYDLAVTVCDQREALLLSREGATYVETRNAIAETRKRCDLVFAAFESARRAQLVARQVVDAATNGQAEWEQATEATIQAVEAMEAARRALKDVPWLQKPPELPPQAPEEGLLEQAPGPRPPDPQGASYPPWEADTETPVAA